MKAAPVIIVVVAAWLAAIFLTVEGALALAFGWLPFLGRVLSRITVYWPSVLVALATVALFAIGVHFLGRSLLRGRSRWRPRWTLAIVFTVFVMFAAGISMVGVVHQVGWLMRSKQPLMGEHLRPDMNVQNNMKHVALGLWNNETATGRLPAAATFSAAGEILHGWETQLLPYILYHREEIDLKKPWNDPANQEYFKCVIPEFINPGFRPPPLENPDGYGLNNFAANSRLIRREKSPSVRELKNGASKIIMFGEVNEDFSPWGRPLNVRDPAAGINQGPKGYGGPMRNGALFSMADGSARFVRNDIDPEVLQALSEAAVEDEQSDLD